MNKTKAYKKLKLLAKNPYDLTDNLGLNKDRISNYKAQYKDFRYYYYAQRVDEEVLKAFQELADESSLVNQYQKMLNGDVINKIENFESENRQVLHTSTRNCFSELNNEDLKNSGKAVDEAKEELKKLKQFTEDLDNNLLTNENGETFTDIILVGIGGSDLGPRAIYYALKNYSNPFRQVHFISNVDSDDAISVLNATNLQRSLVVVISKSGTTLETLTNEKLVALFFEKAKLDPSKHFLCVTGKGSPMDNPKNYLRVFYMFDYIGGRYSSTSMVGGVILAFSLGYDIFLEFLRGARELDLNSLEKNVYNNLSLLAALIGVWNRNFLNCDTLAVLPYSQALIRFVAHLQQCDMESNGKSINRRGETLSYNTGPIIWGEPGTNGQHAFYQSIHQGKTIIPCDFIGFEESQYGGDIKIQDTSCQQKLLANLLSQSVGLATGKNSENPNKVFLGNRPNSLLIMKKLTPVNVGRLLAFYENKIAFQGFIWNINSFDQEGVQLGKNLANDLLDVMASRQEFNSLKVTHQLARELNLI